MATASALSSSPAPIQYANCSINSANSQLMRQVATEIVTFGPQEWMTYFGDPGEAPPLPDSVLKKIIEKDPLNVGLLKDNYQLLFYPKTINGQPRTLNRIERLALHPKLGFPAGISFSTSAIRQRYGDLPAPESHWALISKRPLQHSNLLSTYSQKEALVTEQEGYSVASMLDVVTLALTTHVRSETYLFPGPDFFPKVLHMGGGHPVSIYTILPETLTESDETYNLIAGGFNNLGLSVRRPQFDREDSGIAAKIVL